MSSATKRQVPLALQKILKVDVYVTDLICNVAEKCVPLRSLRVHYKLLEVSCHGLLWLAGWLFLIWVLWRPSLFQMQVNFYLGLLIDIVAVAIIKALTRRRRPAANRDDMFMTIGPDKYSFPSGHVSRACYIAFFFIYLYPVHIIFIMPLLAWSASVTMSRILMRRHHLLDVLGGIVLGVFEVFVIFLFWIDQDTSLYLVSSISDEKISGGDYHV
uniref:Phosphatidic acid phosphatase type 2/haloperoxidase domain-containing protein n=1 Tax=Clastoptera arizonana TaxID=38151 RepID=A0A1B6D5H9_9HEMI